MRFLFYGICKKYHNSAKKSKKYPNIPTHELLQKYWVKDETGQVAK